MPRRQPLSDRHVDVLRWIADGCPDREWPDESHKLSARALESRGLARVRRKGKLWHAVLTDDGQHYLDHGRYPEPQPPEPVLPQNPAGRGQEAGRAAAMTARLAVRQAISGQDRRSLSAARARIARQAAHPSLLKDIPMRYKVVVSRVQTAERHVRAISEEEAIGARSKRNSSGPTASSAAGTRSAPTWTSSPSRASSTTAFLPRSA